MPPFLPAKIFLKTQLTERDEVNGPNPVGTQGSLAETSTTAGSVDVAILMCTFNGAAYLQQQLDSFSNQSIRNWTLYVSDDSSTDATRSILLEYQQRWGADRLVIFDGPCKGFGKNFISLIRRPEVKGSFFAFSDQDDLWFSDKLERAVSRLLPLNNQMPALYCSRTRLIDAVGNVTGLSPLFSKPPSFQNALVQSLAGANTMLINPPARDLLLGLPEDTAVTAHDWLAYLLVTACGGVAIYDSNPSLDYRQHASNLIGANASYRDRFVRLKKMMSGRFVEWNNVNLHILNAALAMMTPENRATLKHFENGRKLNLPGRVMALLRSGVYRQTLPGNLTLYLAACLGKI